MNEEQVNPFAPQEQVYTNFGEITFAGLFTGGWTDGQGYVPYDPSIHKRQVQLFKFKAFSIGSSFDEYEQNLTATNKKWHVFYNSIQKVTGNAMQFLIDHTGGSFYAKWEMAKAGQYKSKDVDETGKPIMKDSKGYKILAIYPDLATAQTAYDEHRGNAPLPADSILPTEERVVATIPIEQLVIFADATVNPYVGSDGKVDLAKLIEGVDKIPMMSAYFVLDGNGEKAIPLTLHPKFMEEIKRIEKKPII